MTSPRSRVRSHVDPILFVRYMHIGAEDVDRDVPELLAQAPDQARYLRAWRQQYEHSIHSIFHEGYHFWQGIRLPYLYWFALLGLRGSMQMFHQLSARFDDHHHWEAVIPALYRLQMGVRCFRTTDGSLVLGFKVPPDEAIDEVRLSPLDLIEAAASVAEYQIAVGPSDSTDTVRYTRWRKRNASYEKIPSFVERTLGDSTIALRCFIPMVNAAFGTTDPPRAFASLLAHLRGNLDSGTIADFIAQPEPCRWSGLMNLMLDEHEEFEAHPDATSDVLDPPYCRLTLAPWLGARTDGGEPLVHPVLTPLASAWREREAEDPAYGWLLDQPAWVGYERFWAAMNDLGPPVTVVRFHLPRTPSRVFSIVNENLDLEVRDVLTMWSAIRRAAWLNFDPEARLCHHVACPEYRDNYCNAYPIIPEDYRKCGFPQRLQRLRVGLADLIERKADA